MGDLLTSLLGSDVTVGGLLLTSLVFVSLAFVKGWIVTKGQHAECIKDRDEYKAIVNRDVAEMRDELLDLRMRLSARARSRRP